MSDQLSCEHPVSLTRANAIDFVLRTVTLNVFAMPNLLFQLRVYSFNEILYILYVPFD